MLAHFKDYNDVAGDHPLNLLSTTLALNRGCELCGNVFI